MGKKTLMKENFSTIIFNKIINFAKNSNKIRLTNEILLYIFEGIKLKSNIPISLLFCALETLILNKEMIICKKYQKIISYFRFKIEHKFVSKMPNKLELLLTEHSNFLDIREKILKTDDILLLGSYLSNLHDHIIALPEIANIEKNENVSELYFMQHNIEKNKKIHFVHGNCAKNIIKKMKTNKQKDFKKTIKNIKRIILNPTYLQNQNKKEVQTIKTEQAFVHLTTFRRECLTYCIESLRLLSEKNLIRKSNQFWSIPQFTGKNSFQVLNENE